MVELGVVYRSIGRVDRDLAAKLGTFGTATVHEAMGRTGLFKPYMRPIYPGAQYGIPFPVLARASFGVLGANVAAVLRALVACGWFGIDRKSVV